MEQSDDFRSVVHLDFAGIEIRESDIRIDTSVSFHAANPIPAVMVAAFVNVPPQLNVIDGLKARVDGSSCTSGKVSVQKKSVLRVRLRHLSIRVGPFVPVAMQ